jgi:hypothetical protein
MNLSKRRSPEFMWVVDLKGDHGPSTRKGACGGCRFTLLEGHS